MSDCRNPEKVLAMIDRALAMVEALCRPRGTAGAREWEMSIPARADRDPDLVIADALFAARRVLLAQLSPTDHSKPAEWSPPSELT